MKLLSADEYVHGITQGDRVILSRAITLIESSNSAHQELSQTVVQRCLPKSGNALRIGITGVPGVGKSTFIESFGTHLIAQGKKIAVLAIDPSSNKTGGSILGDKTRMSDLSNNKGAYIRPSPSSGSLGGVARTTRESMILFEAAGFDVIIIETVGVGQSEVTVHGMVDCFVLLMLAGAGDELQGIKRGIMEMADLMVINKADGDNIEKAKIAQIQYANALHLFPPTNSGWIPSVSVCSAIEQKGIDTVWETIQSFKNTQVNSGIFDTKRVEQLKFWLRESIQEALEADFYQSQHVIGELKAIEQQVLLGEITSYNAARTLLNKYNKGN